MDPVGARTPRPLIAIAAAALGAAALAGGCGGSGDEPPTPAEQLAQPASAWADLSDGDQHDVLHACRLEAAITAAAQQAGPAGAAAPQPVARNRAFLEVLHLPASDLRDALDGLTASGGPGAQRLGPACLRAAARQIAAAGIGTAPRADFGAPLRTTAEGLRLPVVGGRTAFPVRLTPGAGARLTIGDAPGHAPSGIDVAIARHGDRASVRLTHVPVGTSYLRATVRTARASWHGLITLTGEPADGLRPPRTFAPMVLKGDGSRGFDVVYVPRDARATVTTDGAPLTLSAARTVLLAHPLGGPRRATAIPAGRYEHVRVRTRGEWSIRIVPAERAG
ncbi:MAG TPA: hypothetical protein VFT50_13285 [Baekduia sp.]|nr:hypothetical protein [Baekduia sp.]